MTMAELQPDSLIHATAAEGDIRCMAALTTNLVAEAAARHGASSTATAALGRTLTGCLLLGAELKELDRLTVQIVCDGPIAGITAETNARGDVRGYARNPGAEVPLNREGKLDVANIVGKGMFYVTHESGYNIGLYREPYRGSVPLVSGEIGEDFAYYLGKSEQLPSAVLLGVLVRARADGERYVGASGGLIIQIMPGADEKLITSIEASVKKTPHTTKLIEEGAGPIDLLRTALDGLAFKVLNEVPVRFACSCSYERAVSLISSIDRNELESMLMEDRGARMTCHFCNETYCVDESTMQELLQNRRA